MAVRRFICLTIPVAFWHAEPIEPLVPEGELSPHSHYHNGRLTLKFAVPEGADSREVISVNAVYSEVIRQLRDASLAGASEQDFDFGYATVPEIGEIIWQILKSKYFHILHTLEFTDGVMLNTIVTCDDII
jgi:hypothetical protein